MPKPSRFFAIAICLALSPASSRFSVSAMTTTQSLARRFGVPESCLASKDLVVRALERVRADSNVSEIQDANQLLKSASDLCAESGEAWYYRSVVETRLGHKPQADYALRQARLFPSEALAEGVNPFVLSTPSSRSAGPAGDTPGKPPETVPDGPPQKWALVIGVGQFQYGRSNANPNGIPPLAYTTNDASEFAKALKDTSIGQFPESHVSILENEQATNKNIRVALNAIARNAGRNDIVVIYVATHGTPRDSDVAGINYLVTYDTEMDTQDDMYATAFPMVDLANAVATRMKALRTLVILDTCYSGGSFISEPGVARLPAKSAGPTPQMLERMSQGTGRIVMAASRADEESLESPAFGHGFFTYYLLDALKTEGAKRPLSQLFASVAEKVSQTATSVGKQQHPMIYRSGQSADFALTTPSATTSTDIRFPAQASTRASFAFESLSLLNSRTSQ